jgi:SSS family solute:Na+ symporter
MTASLIIMGITFLYIIVTTGIGLYTKKFSRSSENYMTGGKGFGPLVIGVLMMSEFIGTAATIGTAQTAFSKGISASWTVLSITVAFILFAYTVAKKFHESGEYTISGAISKTYGNSARLVTSVIMIYALFVVNISMIAGGAATLSAVLKIPPSIAAVVVALVTIVYVASGGMFAVVYTNFIHAAFKYMGLVLAVAFGLAVVGGLAGMKVHLKPEMFSWTGVGLPTIFAWSIANIGSIFSTQYIIQAVCSTKDEGKAKKASIYAGIMVIPVGVMAALTGMAAKIHFPNISPAEALPIMATLMNPFLGGLMIAGLIAVVLGTIAASTIGATALLLKDFYLPFFNKNATDKQQLRFSRLATVALGLLPIPFAIFTPEIINTTFFARALRTTIAVVVVLMFYFPKFSSGRGATWGMIVSVIATTAWYLAKNPFGIDNIYIGLVAPILVMAIDHLFKQQDQKQEKDIIQNEKFNIK